MHIPDGFLTPPVLVATALVSVPAVIAATRRAGGEAQGAVHVPRLGVLGAFVFAAQMINFPVGLGASGHLVGGALLTAVVGPAAATVVMTAILIIQALVFQDGGILALGANVLNMAVIGVWVAAWQLKLLPASRRLGAFLAGFGSVFAGAMLCMAQLSLSGVKIPAGVLGVSVGVFAISAVLEGVITASVLSALDKVQPGWLAAPVTKARPVMAGISIAAIVLATGGFLFASSQPDGLEHLAAAAGFDSREQVVLNSPMPDYEAIVAGNPWVRKAGAGLAGISLTFFAVAILARWTTRFRSA